MKEYGRTSWCIDDVKSVHPKWTDAECEKWLIDNEKYLVDAAVRAGWNVISTPEDGEI